MKWVSTKKNLPPKWKEVFLYDEENHLYNFGYWGDGEWTYDGGFSTSKGGNSWSHWAKPVPPKKEE